MKTSCLIIAGGIWAMAITSAPAQQSPTTPAAAGLPDGRPTQGAMRRTYGFPMRRWSDQQGYHLQIFLGSDDQSAVDLKLHRGYLIVSGSHVYQADRNSTRGGYRFEHQASRFSRRFRLPAVADTRHMTRRMEKGVLTVTFPRIREHDWEQQPPRR